MPWAKLDDTFYDNPKITAAGNEAVGAFCRFLSYSSRHLTDGVIPAEQAEFIAGRKRVVERLLSVGLVERIETGYWIPDYLQFNTPSEKAVEEREKAKERMAELRAARRAAVRGNAA